MGAMTAGNERPSGNREEGDVFSVDAPARPTRHFHLLPRRAELITSQKHTRGQNLRKRKTIYLILQLARIPLIGLAILTYLVWNNWWLAGVVFVVSVPLPWVAVVIANEHGEVADKRQRNVYKPAAAREARAAALNASKQHACGTEGSPRGALGAGPRDGRGDIIDADS